MDTLLRLLEFGEDEVELKHIRDFQLNGIPDEQWIPEVAAKEGWVVITADRGKKGGATEKLPRICAQHGVTHVILSSAVHHQKTMSKIISIMSVWADLIELTTSSARGSRFSIRLKSQNGPVVIVPVSLVNPLE